MFLYFPLEMYFRGWVRENPISPMDFILSAVLPLVLAAGLIRVSRVGWYTLVTLIALWGVRDLFDYYVSRGATVSALLIHLGIYSISLAYFINPRIRHLYFDPKARWWRSKPRYETHMPLVVNQDATWLYPVLRNISEGGCFIETNHPFEMNTKLDLMIPLPVPLNVSVIKSRGEVRWVSRGGQRAGMGIQFEELAPNHAKAVKSFVQRSL